MTSTTWSFYSTRIASRMFKIFIPDSATFVLANENALVGLGARIKKDYSSLTALINIEAKQSHSNAPFRFKTVQPKILMKTLHSGNSFITIVINKSKEKRKVVLEVKRAIKPGILFADN
jgi:beta-galactosidase